MVNWTIKKHRHRWYAYGKKPKRYLGADGKPHRYVHYFKSKSELVRAMKWEPLENYKRKQKMTSPVDWSQPLQTLQDRPLKARLICDDRKSPTHKRLVLIEYSSNSDLEWVAQCGEDGNGVMVGDNNVRIRIVNVPTKTPYGREEWERLSRVRLAEQGYQHVSVPVGCIDNLGVRIGERTLLFENAAKEFITMDGKELYK